MRIERAIVLVFMIVGSSLLIRPSNCQTNSCSREAGKIVCVVNAGKPNALGPLHVPNESTVIIRITQKSPFDDCTLAEVKLAEIKEQDPIATILQLLTKAATGASLPSSAVEMSQNIKNQKNTGRALTKAEELHEDMLDFESILKSEITDTSNIIESEEPGSLRALAKSIDEMFLAPPRTKDQYQLKIPSIEPELSTAVSKPDPSLAAEQLRSGILQDQLKQIITVGPTPNSNDVKTIPSDEELLNTIVGQLSALRENYDSIAAVKVQFRLLLTFLKQTDSSLNSGSDPFSKDLPMLPNRQQTATTSITCSNTITKKASSLAIPVTVMYEGSPRLSVSVGPLLSTIAKQKLGTIAVSTGVDSTGKPTFASDFAVVDHAPAQVVPFAFLSYRLLNLEQSANPAKAPRYTLNASTGVGVNPNSGSNEIEFFFGVGFGIKKLMVQVGDHVGRFQEGFTGGFNIGDTVPPSFPSALPLRKVYKNGFGIALSYKLPL